MNRRRLLPSNTRRSSHWSARTRDGAANRLRAVAVAAIMTAIPAVTLAQQPGPGNGSVTISGEVAERGTDNPITGATIKLTRPDGKPAENRTSNESGEFALGRVPLGTYIVTVERIGYHTAEASVELSDPDVHIRVELVRDAVEMEGLVVATRRSKPGMRDFDRRRLSDISGGTFFTREDIEARNPLRVTDLLRMVPGVHVTPSGSFGNEVSMRGGCRPALIIDGMRVQQMTGTEIDELLSPHDLEGIEVYRSSFIPAEFGQGCGAVAAWTRRGDPENGRPFSWKRIAAALGIAAGVFLLAR